MCDPVTRTWRMYSVPSCVVSRKQSDHTIQHVVLGVGSIVTSSTKKFRDDVHTRSSHHFPSVRAAPKTVELGGKTRRNRL